MYTNVRKIRRYDGRLELKGPCVVTKKPYSVIVSEEAALNYYQLGMKAQDAFPELAAEQREFLISGTSPEGWKQVFGDSTSEVDSVQT